MTVEFWFLIGAALVFWMQAGFAMVETGFTRAKNAGNIIMKNLMDFCIGTVVFSLLGYTLMMGEDSFGPHRKAEPGPVHPFQGLHRIPGGGLYRRQLLRVQPGVLRHHRHHRLRGHGGADEIFRLLRLFRRDLGPDLSHRGPLDLGRRLAGQLGFHDFAGSCAIHMVGGICALIGATMLGPRIGKFRDRTGRQGHQGQRHSRPLHPPGRAGRVHPVAGLVRLQRRGGHLSWSSWAPSS